MVPKGKNHLNYNLVALICEPNIYHHHLMFVLLHFWRESPRNPWGSAHLLLSRHPGVLLCCGLRLCHAALSAGCRCPPSVPSALSPRSLDGTWPKPCPTGIVASILQSLVMEVVGATRTREDDGEAGSPTPLTQASRAAATCPTLAWSLLGFSSQWQRHLRCPEKEASWLRLIYCPRPDPGARTKGLLTS